MDLDGIEWEWMDYFFARGDDFNKFWEKFLNAKMRNILIIIGIGFDPRMCVAAESIMKKGGDGKRDCILIEFDEGENSPSQRYRLDVNNNLEQINNIFNGKGAITSKKIKMIGKDNKRIGSRCAANLFLSEYPAARCGDEHENRLKGRCIFGVWLN